MAIPEMQSPKLQLKIGCSFGKRSINPLVHFTPWHIIAYFLDVLHTYLLLYNYEGIQSACMCEPSCTEKGDFNTYTN